MKKDMKKVSKTVVKERKEKNRKNKDSRYRKEEDEEMRNKGWKKEGKEMNTNERGNRSDGGTR